jgi:predicted RND superfamily exporter protein
VNNRLFLIYESLVLRRPLLAILTTLTVIGWLATHIPSFKLDASADSLVLEGDQSLKYYREIGQRYSSEDFLLVTFRPKQDLFSESALATLDKLRGDLAALDGVSSVLSILDVPLLESPKIHFQDLASGSAMNTLRTPDIDIELVRKELVNSPIYRSLLTSNDGQTTALQINLPRDQRYLTLLNSRDSLREQSHIAPLSAEQQQQLEQLEQEFRQYAVAYNERQSQLVDKVREVIVNYRGDATVFLGGVPMIAADMISFVKSDLLVFGSGIAIFIIVTMAVIFRRLTWVLLPLLTCVLSAAFMLGLITWQDWRMTVISSNFVALLLIITLSITIHLVVSYRELLSTHPEMTQGQLVRAMTYLMMKPSIYTVLTTMVSFASLVVSGIRPVIDFGWMMTVGVAAALGIAFIILPAGLLLVKKPEIVPTGRAGVATTLRFAAFTERHGAFILWFSFMLTLVSAYGISRLEVENRFIDYFHKHTEIYQGMEVIDAQLGGTIPLEIIIDAEQVATGPDADPVASAVAPDDQATDGAINAESEPLDEAFADDFAEEFEGDSEEDFANDFSDDEQAEPSVWFNRAGLNRIEEVHDYIDSLDETGKVMSLATPYKLLRKFTSEVDDIQLALLQKKLPDDINDILIDPYLNEEIDQARITVRVMETSHTLRRDDLLKEIRTHLTDKLGFQEEQIHLTGMLVLYNNMLQSLYRSQILTIGAVFLAIVLMFVVLFRSLPIALIAIAPNLLSAGVVLGMMGLAAIPLDIMTVTIAAITIGIAVDDTIHYIHRFRAEFPKDNNYLATMYRCHGSIGKAMFYTSIIIVVGFSILALSNFTPSIYFGLLTATAMFAALMGALLLLPQLLITFQPLGPNVDIDPAVDVTGGDK